MYPKKHKPKYRQEVIYVKKEENYEEISENKIDSTHHSKKKKCYNSKNLKKTEFEETKEISGIKGEEESLTNILIRQFQKKKIDCPICFNRISSEARIWNCKQCFQPFHISCISKWMQNSNLQKEKNQNIFTWSCPKCCYLYTEKNPEYFCFCGKLSNPEYDPFILPHSCGEQCNKKRSPTCPHPCLMLCHPGPCPSCILKEKVVICYCGKSKITTECGDSLDYFQCDKICEKLLSCGKHICSQKCHKSQCEKCPLTNESICFCGKQKKMVSCGEENFSCQQICNKPLSCKNHFCQQICHQGDCEKCWLQPSEVLTCPCGKTPLSTLMGENARKSCLDPISVCGLPCGKLLSCKKHYCKSMCHTEKDCPKCKELVTQECRCKKKKRKVECWQVYQKDAEEFLCEKICKKKKACGIHSCGMMCCPAGVNESFELHLCLKICGKKLNCGLHYCDFFCHLGFCKPCPIIIPHPISCICGKTILQPPLPCGSKRPICHYPCSRLRECGHPCALECHEDPCPPCDFLVNKLCSCKKFMINLVSCSKEVSCGEPCLKLLKCGHICGEVCHSGPCPKENDIDGCQKKCGKTRSDCQHKCLSLCHPNEKECPKVFCQVLMKIKCDCGSKFGFVECGVVKNKTIKCDTSCTNKQRFGGFTEAESYRRFSALLVRFAKNHLTLLTRLEQKIENMIKLNEKIFEFPLQNVDSLQIFSLESLIVTHYQMELELYLHIKNPYMVVIATKNMKQPRLKLSEYLKDIEKGIINSNETLPFACSFKFYHPNKINFYDEIEEALFEGKIVNVLERRGEKTLLVHFWDNSEAEFAAKKLKKRNLTNYQFETNNKLKIEEMKFLNYKADIIDKDKELIKEEEKID